MQRIKKFLAIFLLVFNLNQAQAVDTHGSLINFFDTIHWDSFWDSFTFKIFGCDCYPKFFVQWCDVWFCDFLPAIQETHIEPFANFSASAGSFNFVGLNTGSGSSILGVKKGVTRKSIEKSEKTDTTASFMQSNMLPFVISSIIGFIDVTQTICLGSDAVDSFYISDIDPLYQNDGLNNIWTLIKSPTRLLDLLIPAFEMRCIVDCLASSINTPLDAFYTCNGCRGGLGSQDSGWGKHNNDPMENAETLAYKLIHNFHERFKFKDISSNACKSLIRTSIKKSQYKISLGATSNNKPYYFGKIRFGVYDGKDSIKSKDEYSFWLWKKRKFCGFFERICTD